MEVVLNKLEDCHNWELKGIIITSLIIDSSSLRILNWTLEGNLDIRLEVPFLFLSDNKELNIDPENTMDLCPMLKLLNTEITNINVYKSGILEINFSESRSLKVDPHQKYEAWEVEGSGNFEDANYLCGLGGGSPWG